MALPTEQNSFVFRANSETVRTGSLFFFAPRFDRSHSRLASTRSLSAGTLLLSKFVITLTVQTHESSGETCSD